MTTKSDTSQNNRSGIDPQSSCQVRWRWVAKDTSPSMATGGWLKSAKTLMEPVKCAVRRASSRSFGWIGCSPSVSSVTFNNSKLWFDNCVMCVAVCWDFEDGCRKRTIWSPVTESLCMLVPSRKGWHTHTAIAAIVKIMQRSGPLCSLFILVFKTITYIPPKVDVYCLHIYFTTTHHTYSIDRFVILNAEAGARRSATLAPASTLAPAGPSRHPLEPERLLLSLTWSDLIRIWSE